MSESSVSQSFNVNDIRRIRIEDDLRYRDMTPEEVSRDIHERAKVGHQIIDEIRRKKAKQHSA